MCVKMKFGMVALAGLVAATSVAHAKTAARKDKWDFTGGADGDEPKGDLLDTKDGSLIGVTNAGGSSDNGVVFSFKPYGSGQGQSVLWNFTGGADGSTPMAGLVADNAGALYGTAARDGAGGAGTVYRLNPPDGPVSWTETTLWSFSGNADGGQPVSTLVVDRSGSGVLYGTTSFGGASNLGVVFALLPPSVGQTNWTEKVLWSFTGGKDGASPVAGLVQTSSGALYGTTSKGGNGVGTVFQLTPPVGGAGNWSLNTIWTFTGGADGATPVASLVADPAGNLYGTTQFGGSNFCPQANWPFYGEPNTDSNYALNAAYVTKGGNACGVVFELSPPVTAGAAWTQSVIFAFAGDQFGCNPLSDVYLDGAGTIYGTAPINDAVYPKMVPPPNLWTGDVYKLTPPTKAGSPYTATVLSSFEFKTHGFNASGGLVAGPANSLWGTTIFGGKSWTHLQNFGFGTLYSVTP